MNADKTPFPPFPGERVGERGITRSAAFINDQLSYALVQEPNFRRVMLRAGYELDGGIGVV